MHLKFIFSVTWKAYQILLKKVLLIHKNLEKWKTWLSLKRISTNFFSLHILYHPCQWLSLVKKVVGLGTFFFLSLPLHLRVFIIPSFSRTQQVDVGQREKKPLFCLPSYVHITTYRFNRFLFYFNGFPKVIYSIVNKRSLNITLVICLIAERLRLSAFILCHISWKFLFRNQIAKRYKVTRPFFDTLLTFFQIEILYPDKI